MDKFTRTNLASWEARVPVHAASRFYDVRGFLRGRSSLLPLELSEVGTVKKLRLLHLQCHFGLDTLSWARRGARVTGVDFSPSAVAKARELAARFLKPGGFVYIADDHPFAGVFDDSGRRPVIDYFMDKALLVPPCGTYTDGPRRKMPATYEWWYTVSGLLDAVKSAGLRLDYFREHPFTAWRRFPGMRKGKDGLWRDPGGKLPLLFSLKAYKP